MNALMYILNWHRAEPGRAALMVKETPGPDGQPVRDAANTLEPDPTYVPERRADDLSPDKILVYSAFPSHNELFLFKVSLMSPSLYSNLGSP